MFAIINPITTVVVLPGVVYKSSGVPALAGMTSCETTLNVLAIFSPYPNAIANAVASSVVAAPISDASSDALLPSIVVPFTLKKSSSATPEPKVATLPLDIPEVGTCDVRAKVPAVAGNVIVTFPEKSECAGAVSCA